MLENENIIYDLYNYMPGHGENSVEVSIDNVNLIITISFDNKSGIGVSTKQIMFRSYSYYSVGLFPGIGIMQKSDYEFQAGCVIKTEGSEFSKRWKEYWQKRQEMRECNLYVMFWTSENKAIHVIADSVELI